MYSTLLFLDRPRHLRYDLQSVVDLDQLLPGGFKTIFTMKSNLDALRIIFWAGLKHEDIDLDFGKTEEYLHSALEHGWTIEKFIEIFTYTLWNQGWLSKSGEKSKEPVNIETLISRMQEMNYKYLHFTPKEFYAITPQEFIDMIEMWGEQDNHNTALICSVIANCSGAKKANNRPFEIDDFMPNRKPKVQTPEQMKNILMGAFG